MYILSGKTENDPKGSKMFEPYLSDYFVFGVSKFQCSSFLFCIFGTWCKSNEEQRQRTISKKKTEVVLVGDFLRRLDFVLQAVEVAETAKQAGNYNLGEKSS